MSVPSWSVAPVRASCTYAAVFVHLSALAGRPPVDVVMPPCVAAAAGDASENLDLNAVRD